MSRRARRAPPPLQGGLWGPSHTARHPETKGEAGFWLRVGAKLIDHGLWSFVETAAVGLGAWLNALGHPPWVIASGFVVSTLLWYTYVFEMTRRRGQTVGKMVARVQVVTAEGAPPPSGIMARRLAVELVFDMLGLLGMVAGLLIARAGGLSPAGGAVVGAVVGEVLGLADPAAILFTPRKQALHDLAAGTFVVRVAEGRRRALVLAALLGTGLSPALTFGIVRPFFVEAYFVPSGSMEPTIEIGDRILANKLVRRLRPPRRGEIVMFQAPAWATSPTGAQAEETTFVKRVAGVGGDRLKIHGGQLYRNSRPVNEPYLKEAPSYTWPPDVASGGQIQVPRGQVVMLGDNRNDSNDSHAWKRISADGRQVEPAPFVPLEALRGKLVYRYWPPDRMGTVTQEEAEGPKPE